ncbi:uncharacterized protein JCM6883_006775 [Sporobolomyces salmoneus]|uniref:uncharacterized protein n=1 Tax=Sporobolomyces salmoneus TaxID=183962 RepID=UPI00317F660E
MSAAPDSPSRKRSYEGTPSVAGDFVPPPPVASSSSDPNKRPRTDGTLQGAEQENEDAKQSTVKDQSAGGGLLANDEPATISKRMTTARRYLATQTHPVIIPSYSTWFSLASLHAIERRSLPEFFNGKNRSKTPTIYKDYRDFMIHTYRLNPSEYLTVTACRRNLAGDVCAIMRVHAFLEQWGLINYQIDADTRPSSLGPPFTGHFRILIDSPRGLAPLHPGTKPTSNPSATLRTDLIKTDPSRPGAPDARLSSETASSLAAQAAAASSSDPSAPTVPEPKPCYTCGTTTTSVRYTSLQSHGSIALCPACYSEGRFPSSLHSGDFVRIDAGDAYSHSDSNPWSDQETLLLLEGLEMFAEDWDQISDHVGTRTKEQCIVRFLKLPIEDRFLEGAGNEVGPLRHLKAIGDQEDNPVMSVVAFLASAVDPKVAAKAAGEAIEQLEKSLRKKVENKEEESKEDAMEVEQSTGGGGGSTEPTTNGAQPNGREEPEDKSTSSPRSNLQKAALVALGSAAAKAHALALEEDASLHSLVTSIVDAQVRKLDLKMKHFDELESLLEMERRAMEQQKQEMFNEKAKMQKMMNEVMGLWQRAKQGQAGGISQQEIQNVLSQSTGKTPQAFPVQNPGPPPQSQDEEVLHLS